MDFDAAIAAHSAWKTKLRNYLAKPNNSLDPASIELDSECALGKWIYGEAGKHSADRDFNELRQTHARFHQAAAALVRRADGGENVSEEAALGAHSPFAQLSERVIVLIMEMKRKALAPAAR